MSPRDLLLASAAAFWSSAEAPTEADMAELHRCLFDRDEAAMADLLAAHGVTL